MKEIKEKIVKFWEDILLNYEFELLVDDNKQYFQLSNLEGEKLNNIDGKKFKNLGETMEKLTIYNINDYIYLEVEKYKNFIGINIDESFEITSERFLNSDIVKKILTDITPQIYIDLIKSNVKVEYKDINNIIDRYDTIEKRVERYFKENDIKNLMEYGTEVDEGLYSLSSIYKELLDKMNIKYKHISTEDVSDGKYATKIYFNDNDYISVNSNASSGEKVITENLKYIIDKYIDYRKELFNNKINNDINYDY